MNSVFLDGIVGKIDRTGDIVKVRIIHKEGYFHKVTQEYKRDDSWFSVHFFGKRGLAAESEIQINDRIVVEAALTTFPKEGPTSRVLLNGVSFHVLIPFEQKASYKDDPQIPDGDTL